MNYQLVESISDILIIGGGIAGCIAAIKAKEQGLKVTLLEKADTRRSGNAGSGIDHFWSYIPPFHEKIGYSMEDMIKDHKNAGMGKYGLVREDLIELVVKNSYERILELEKYGLKFRFDDSNFPGNFRIVPQFHSLPSSFNFEGRDIKQKLTEVMKKKNVEIINRVMSLELLEENGQVYGAIGVSTREDKIYCIQAKTVILSTSGKIIRLSRSSIGNNFERFYSPTGCTGDGKLMAINAGAEVANMEFYGIDLGGTTFFNFSMAAGAPGGSFWPCARVVDSKGNVIVDRRQSFDYNRKDLKELYEKEIVENRRQRENMKKLFKEGQPLYLDFEAATDEELRYILWSLSHEGKMWLFLKNIGEDIEKFRNYKIPFAKEDRNSNNVFCDGIWVDRNCETTVKNLYAAGNEVAGIPLPSASAALVLGWEAGIKAAERAKEIKEIPDIKTNKVKEIIEKCCEIRERKTGDDWIYVERAVQNIMDRYTGFVLSNEALDDGLKLLRDLRDTTRLKAENSHQLMRCLEVENLMSLGEIVMESAKKRTNSIGPFKKENTEELEQNSFLSVCKRENELVFKTI